MPSHLTIGKRKVWRASVKVNGKRRQKNFDAKKDAIAWELAMKEEMKNPPKPPTDTGFLEMCNGYLEHIEKRVTKNTFREKKKLFKELCNRWGITLDEDISVTNIKPITISNYLNWRRENPSANSANRDLRDLKALFNWAQNFLDINHNPAKNIEPFAHQRKHQYFPPRGDVLAILQAADPADRVLLQTFLNTAARKSEIFRLQWDDLDFAARTITLRTRKTKGGLVREDTLPLTDELFHELVWWREWPSRPFKRSPYVFVCTHSGRQRGKPYKDRRKFLPRLCNQAGVREFQFHGLRRHVATHLASKGVPAKVIQRILRHQNLATTERYIGRGDQDLAQSMELLATEEKVLRPVLLQEKEGPR